MSTKKAPTKKVKKSATDSAPKFTKGELRSIKHTAGALSKISRRMREYCGAFKRFYGPLSWRPVCEISSVDELQDILREFQNGKFPKAYRRIFSGPLAYLTKLNEEVKERRLHLASDAVRYEASKLLTFTAAWNAAISVELDHLVGHRCAKCQTFRDSYTVRAQVLNSETLRVSKKVALLAKNVEVLIGDSAERGKPINLSPEDRVKLSSLLDTMKIAADGADREYVWPENHAMLDAGSKRRAEEAMEARQKADEELRKTIAEKSAEQLIKDAEEAAEGEEG